MKTNTALITPEAIQQQLEKISIKLMLQEPFFGHYFSHLVKEVNRDINTVELTLVNQRSIKLAVNPDYWYSLSAAQCYGVIKHEVLHLVLKHLVHQPLYQHTQLFNIAADIVVNQFINPDQLTANAICLQPFQAFAQRLDIAFAANMDVGYYYRQLSLMLSAQPDNDATNPESKDGKSEEGAATSNPLAALLGRPNDELMKHQQWQQMQALTEAQRDLLEQMINHSIEQTVKRINPLGTQWGNLPAGLRTYLDDLLADLTPTINWRRIIRLFAASSSKTRIKNTLRRPSKRYGTTPGIKIQPKQKLLVALDTSGSIDMDSLALFFSEIDQIWRQGSQVRVIEIDTEIQRSYDYRGTPPNEVKGGGGTSFDPAFEYGNRSWLPDGIIYFTDGYAPEPEIRSRAPILWVISPQGADVDKLTLPGRILKMNPQ